MTRQRQLILGAVAIILIGAVGFLVVKMFGGGGGQSPLSSSTYSCDEGKTIKATFFADSATVVLSDGRTLSLPEKTSAAGARYATKDDNLVFTQQGDKAAIAEGRDGTLTYQNCQVAVPGQDILSTYASTTLGITIKYPKNFILNTAYAYDQFGQKKLINGVKVLIPESMATGTNLSSSDTGISIEQLPRAKNCTADIYIPADVKALRATEAGVEYSIASTSGAGAGNFYEEIVYALTNSKPCIAIRYFIHSTNIGNYPPGAVSEFDRAGLMASFDKIRQSLVLSQ